MIHDPLCVEPQTDYPCKRCWEIECECLCICDILIKARRDEADRVMQLRYREVTGWQDMKEALAWQQGSGHRDRRTTRMNFADWANEQVMDAAVTGYDRGYAAGQRDGVKDAREAVARAPMGSGAYNTKAADLAAIDAIGERA
jgi:hypothetical protein